jgi:alpha-1,3-rhamnosyl/mannosyltransferase
LRFQDTASPNGIKRYSLTLAAELARQGVDVRFSKVYSREFRLGRLRVGGILIRRFTELLPIARGDLLHAMTFHMNPARRPADVVTIHDIMQIRRPELYPQDERSRRQMDEALQRSFRHSWMLTDSRHTRDEVLRQFPDAPRERLVPVHLGVDHAKFWPDVRPPSARDVPVLQALRPGMLNVAVLMNLEMRKRLDLVLEAAAELPFVRIVHAGWPHATNRHLAMNDRVARLIPRLEATGQYVRLGTLTDDDIRLLLSNADLVLHASEDEGFGLPPLEALACGARVLASDIPPHAEVLGDAARLFPLSREGIRKALEAAWDGEALRTSTFPDPAVGLAHAKGFTWERTARATLQVYQLAFATKNSGA